MAENEELSGQENPPDGSKDDPLKKLSDSLFTRIGRLNAEYKEGMDALTKKMDELASSMTKPKDDSEEKEDALKKLLDGDFSVIDERISLREQAKAALEKKDRDTINNIISDMKNSETPFVKDLNEDNLRSIAMDTVKKGYKPPEAVAFAYSQEKSKHLMSLIGNQQKGNLEVSGGGSRRVDENEVKGKLNAAGKEAWEKEKNTRLGGKPLFKDEEDFISQMSPAVRARFVG